MNRRPTPRAASTLLACAMLLAASTGVGRADGEPLKNTLKWSTASEQNNVGFDVYRAEAEDGPFTRITPKPIAGAGTTDEPSAYSYVDDTIEAGKAYYYYVEDIAFNGHRSKFTPVFEAGPKGHKSGDAAVESAARDEDSGAAAETSSTERPANAHDDD